MALFQRSDRHRLRQRIAALRPALFRTALTWSRGSRAQADDLVQECLSRALARVGGLKNPDKLEPWCFSILANCFRDLCRRQRPEEPVDQLPDQRQAPADELVDRERRAAQVRQAVADLPAGQREVLALVDLQGFSYAEVAEILTIPIGTVMSRLSRARGRLKQMLLAAPRSGAAKVIQLERAK